MVAALTFTTADGDVIDLNDGTVLSLRGALRNTGMPPVLQDTVKTPNRDGETWKRMIFEPRFLGLNLTVQGSSFSDLQDQHQTLLTALNPRLGVGMLKYTPAATLYAIDCLVEDGPRFNNYRGPLMDRVAISFRCPDPTWYDPVENNETVANSGSGLSFAGSGVSFDPLSFADGTGTTTINNLGNMASFPTITVPGACTNPIIRNTTTGKKLQFVGLTIGSGENLIIDTKLRTAKIGSISHISKLSADSEFWTLEPGNNVITFSVSSGTVTALVDYLTRFLGV
jgi:phage-related protein